jgi:tetratricopeptide (TPR) repeat protein
LAATSDAELAFRRGKYFSDRYNNLHKSADFDLALSSFRSALERDPSLADAAGEVAMLYEYRFESGTISASQAAPAIEAWASRAVAIDPCSIPGLLALAAVEQLGSGQSTRKMVQYGVKAASCGPTDGRAQFGLGFGTDPAGLSSVALAAYLESHRLDPLYLYAPLNAAVLQRVLGRPEEALRLTDEALKIQPGAPVVLLERALDLIALRRPAEAQSVLAPLEARASSDPLLSWATPMIRSSLALEQRDHAGADAAIAQVLALIDSPGATGLLLESVAKDVAPYLARHGRTKEAVDIFERALRLGAPLPYEILAYNRDLASLTGDPRFPRILTRSRAQFDEALDVLVQARSRGELPAYLKEPLASLLQRLNMQGRTNGIAAMPPVLQLRESDL